MELSQSDRDVEEVSQALGREQASALRVVGEGFRQTQDNFAGGFGGRHTGSIPDQRRPWSVEAEGVEEFDRRDDADALERLEDEQVFVAGDDEVGVAADGGGEDGEVVRIS